MSNIVTEESGKYRSDETKMLAETFKSVQQSAAAILLVGRGVNDPTFEQTLEALRYVARIFGQESERFLHDRY